ncbi:histidine utilization repressor [Agrobacterium vitis]|uniref:Histidine utilization repressor n=1 Tax=Agrobacterium vitis TaxID=373 RepID=A0A368NJ18_AGRVI|nr:MULTISPECIES: histidine utilization repressor [Rhizobium/Agrobacterium group]MCF1501861.1 histidine utilization repressor [Allorhizobium sp. Av2]KAA3505421.1 histidine utilization repressor [Agrobacterium vitis]KAA3519281.1 histidine utilization repressor [Agrobacterium vitis]MBF2712676.1 histidine utilization repressor [Agrobacterium vitis]MCF1480389.1 histidine utilization repressor [Agrobacterium vitis]
MDDLAIEKHAASRYSEIQRDIENKIATGEWGPGARIPPERELVDIYNCSRMTVNKALSSLAASGMITRKRRSGSFVAPPRIEEPLMHIQDIRAEVMAIDRTYTFEITDRSIRKATDPLDARHVGVPVGTRLLTLEVMHYADNLPFTMETRQINLDAVPQVERLQFKDEPPGSWLLHNVPFTDGEHSIRAVSADAILARRLQVVERTACISIARRTWLDEQLITFVRLIYPGDRHRFVVRFKPSAQPGVS